MADKDYEVGKGKPPKHSRFKKGETGNPGGKPGPRKSFETRLRDAIEAALEKDMDTLVFGRPDNPWERMADDLVGSAAIGRDKDRRALFGLMTKWDEAAERHTKSGGRLVGATQGDSLSQGKSQGSGENAICVEPISEAKQDVKAAGPLPSGNISENSEPPRPKRPTIRIGGRLIQEGD